MQGIPRLAYALACMALGALICVFAENVWLALFGVWTMAGRRRSYSSSGNPARGVSREDQDYRIVGYELFDRSYFCCELLCFCALYRQALGIYGMDSFGIFVCDSQPCSSDHLEISNVPNRGCPVVRDIQMCYLPEHFLFWGLWHNPLIARQS